MTTDDSALGSDDRYGLALAAIGGMVFDWDVSSDRVWRSDGLTGLIGIHPNDADPHFEWWADRVHPDDAVAWRTFLITSGLDESRPSEIEYRIQHADSGWRWVCERCKFVFDSLGALTRVVGHVVDISRGKQLELDKGQQEAESRGLSEALRELLDAAPAIILIAEDPMANLTYGNQLAYEFLRVEPGTNASRTGLNGPRNFLVYRDGEQIESHELPMQKAARTNREVRDEQLDILFDEGDLRSIFGTAKPLRNPDGSSRGAIGAFVDVTEMRHALEAVSDAERRFRALVEASPSLVWTAGVSGDLTYASPHWLERFAVRGPSREDMMALIHPDDHRVLLRSYTRARRSGGSFSTDYRLLHPDGKFRWMTLRAVPQHDTEGKLTGFVGTSFDVDELKRARETLQLTQNSLSLAMKGGRMGWWSRDLSTGEVRWSPELEELFGLKADTFRGDESTFLAFVDPRDRDRIRASVDNALRDHQDYTFEFRFHRGDRSIGWMEGRGRGIYDADGRATFVYGLGIDITERKLADQALETSRQTLNLAVDTAGLGVWRREPSADAIETNVHGRRHFGRPPDSFIGFESWMSTVHPEDVAHLRAALRHHGGDPRYDVTYRTVAEDGSTHWIHEVGRRVAPGDGEMADHVAVTQDVTERVERELDLELHVELRTRELRAMNRELEGFTYSIAHDLRAPLRAINSTSHILLEECGALLSTEHQEVLWRQQANASKLAQLIDDLLRLSRIGRHELQREQIGLSELVTEIAEAYDDSPATLVVEPGIVALADPILLRILLDNLLGNAIKYSPDGGEIRVGVIASRGETVFFVRDEGIGFDMDYADRIFRPFERLHREDQFPGTGIGLANVRRIAERHGGRVWAESVPTQGSTFYFTLG